MGPFNLPDLGPVFFFAIVGVILSTATVLGGLGWVIWFAISHVRIV